MQLNQHKRAVPWLASLAVGAAIALPFALRSGVPGLRHDWVWPANGAGLIHWFVVGASGWQPDGFGGALGSPTVNFVLAFLAGLAYAGIPTTAILAIFLTLCFALGQMGMYRLFEALDLRLGALPAWLLGASYAYGPVMFQKSVAGHLYFVCAYALLPWFALCAWRACGEGPGRARNAVAAGLLLAAASTQIQFLFFDAFVAFVIAIARRRRLQNLLAAAGICAIGLLHNVVLLLNAPGVEQSGLLSQHATMQWERDLSGRFSDLALLGGYVHYAQSAVPPALQALYLAGRVFFLALVVGALIAVVVKRRHRRAAAIFAFIGLAALLAAVGWNGPLAPVLQYAIDHTAFFTIFRELYHFMALYAFGSVLLVACGLALLPQGARMACAALTLLVALPFMTMGLQRMVPAVPATAFMQQCPAVNLFALLPAQEPVGVRGQPEHSGIDPARFLSRNGTAGGEPVAVQWALSSAAQGDFAPMQSLGFGCVRWRRGIASFLPSSFEPHTGADFTGFLMREHVLRDATLQPRGFPARSVLSFETPGYRGALDAGLADVTLPPGRSVALTSSFVNNDIRTTWVSGQMWSWFVPDLMNVASVPVVTRAPKISYTAGLPAGSWSQLYVLAAAGSVALNGANGSVIAGSTRGHYRWYRWPLHGERSVTLEFLHAAALARVIVSHDAAWAPPPLRSPGGTREAVAVNAQSMWNVDATLPAFDGAGRLVFGRRFSGGWHLLVDGKDAGPAQRVHGLFNGWDLSPADSGKAVTLWYAPQAFYWWINSAVTLLQIIGLAFVLLRKPLHHSEALHAHRLAGKHV